MKKFIIETLKEGGQKILYGFGFGFGMNIAFKITKDNGGPYSKNN
jgi:hypothetical protein